MKHRVIKSSVICTNTHTHTHKHTFLQEERKNSSENSNTIESLVKVNVVGCLDNLTELCRGLCKERGQILKAIVPQSPCRVGRNELKDFLGRAGDLPQLVPELGIIGRNIPLN